MNTSTATPIVEGDENTPCPRRTTVFACPRNFLDNRFVYFLLTARARGLSIGINMNPDRACNFDCIYCEVDRNVPSNEKDLDLSVMEDELDKALQLVRSGRIRELPAYRGLSDELLQLRHVALSGSGEPTLCPKFAEAVQAVIHVRARNPHDYFKLALLTNGSGLDSPAVHDSMKYFTLTDEIWIKLDAGTQEYMDRVNRAQVSLEKVLANILLVGRQRPIIIQSLFPMVLGMEPPPHEIDEYVGRLNELKNAGAQISLVQIYSAARAVPNPDCTHMKLKLLSRISHRVKAETGLKAEVF